MRRGWLLAVASALLVLLTGCGGSGTVACAGAACNAPPENLNVQPQNSTLLVGVNRVSIALLDSNQTPVAATGVHIDILNPAGHSIATRPLENIAAVYGGIPVYVGIAQFPSAGQYEFLVTGTGPTGRVNGHAFVTVAASGPEIAVGAHVPALHQAVLTDPGVTISMVDSGVPPDTWTTRPSPARWRRTAPWCCSSASRVSAPARRVDPRSPSSSSSAPSTAASSRSSTSRPTFPRR
ncbi:MAG TPA: hypothetical protein VH498_00155 [Candidatus Dormibacteraeota bacterium]|nr:hypothetical protein [Candidatus Dormibacteraeota bacterium]